MAKDSAIKAEIKQGPAFRSVGQEALVALLRTTDVVRHQLAAAIAPSGITLQQYNVLRILRGAEPEGLCTLAIAERMIERAPGITRLIDRLEKKGLVRRQRSQEDRRQVLCRVTPAGLELLETLDEPIDRADDAVLGMLQDRELHRLITLLDRIRAGSK